MLVRFSGCVFFASLGLIAPLALGSPSVAAERATATTGKVYVKVSLSDTGDVRSASLLRDTLGNAIGGEEIRRETIFAAASTTYAPEMHDCVPRRGAYIFESEFSGH